MHIAYYSRTAIVLLSLLVSTTPTNAMQTNAAPKSTILVYAKAAAFVVATVVCSSWAGAKFSTFIINKMNTTKDDMLMSMQQYRSPEALRAQEQEKEKIKNELKRFGYKRSNTIRILICHDSDTLHYTAMANNVSIAYAVAFLDKNMISFGPGYNRLPDAAKKMIRYHEYYHLIRNNSMKYMILDPIFRALKGANHQRHIEHAADKFACDRATEQLGSDPIQSLQALKSLFQEVNEEFAGLINDPYHPSLEERIAYLNFRIDEQEKRESINEAI